MHFLFSRYQQQRGLRQMELFSERMVSDYLFQKDRIFAEPEPVGARAGAVRAARGLARAGRDEAGRGGLPAGQPGRCSWSASRGAGARSRRTWSASYIEQLNEAYNHFFFHYLDAPLLVVNTNAIDFVNNPDDFEDLLKRILSHRQGTVYYAPIERGSRDMSAERPGGRRTRRRAPQHHRAARSWNEAPRRADRRA